jgi:dihydrofolate synthase/folylpolyglutamate synthase
MAMSDAILTRLLDLHPRIIDLKLDRMWRLLDRLGNPERRVPPVIHVAGTNGKGSVVAYCRAIIEAAGLSAHVYTSPHLIKFHERIRLGRPGRGTLISEPDLIALLAECEEANAGEPITFFEITTAAAFLAFARNPADYLVLEVGLGGRLDATNVIDQPRLTVITPVDLDHQQFLGTTLPAIAAEKAGILKEGVPCIVAPQPEQALDAIIAEARRRAAPILISGQEWSSFEQHGRLVYQDESGLLDLPLPILPGRFQIDNAGTAVAAIRALADPRIDDGAIAQGLRQAEWPARMQRLGPGSILKLAPSGTEIWLDGGHNPSAGRAVAETLAELDERLSRPLSLVTGMLKTKEAAGYFRPFKGLARRVITIAIPGEENAISGDELARIARAEGLDASPAGSIEEAVRHASQIPGAPVRLLIGGSLYLAGRVLALHLGETASGVTGTARR